MRMLSIILLFLGLLTFSVAFSNVDKTSEKKKDEVVTKEEPPTRDGHENEADIDVGFTRKPAGNHRP